MKFMRISACLLAFFIFTLLLPVESKADWGFTQVKIFVFHRAGLLDQQFNPKPDGAEATINKWFHEMETGSKKFSLLSTQQSTGDYITVITILYRTAP